MHATNVACTDAGANGLPAGFSIVGDAIKVDATAPAYQALAKGESYVAHFAYDLVDQFNGRTRQTATVTITNDAPKVSAAVTGGGEAGSGAATVSLLQNASDVDRGAVLRITNVVWTDPHTGTGLPAGFTLVGDSIRVDTSNAAFDALRQGETYTARFSYVVIDGSARRSPRLQPSP